MEASRKRKAPNATPTSAEGSASKKLRLLVRVISLYVLCRALLKAGGCFGVPGLCIKDARCCVFQRGDVQGRKRSICDARSVKHGRHLPNPKPAPPSYSAWQTSQPRKQREHSCFRRANVMYFTTELQRRTRTQIRCTRSGTEDCRATAQCFR